LPAATYPVFIELSWLAKGDQLFVHGHDLGQIIPKRCGSGSYIATGNGLPKNVPHLGDVNKGK